MSRCLDVAVLEKDSSWGPPPSGQGHVIPRPPNRQSLTCRERQDSVAAWSVIDLEEDATRSLFEFQLTRASGKVQDWQVRRSVLWPELFEMGL